MGIFKKDTFITGPVVFNAVIPFPIIPGTRRGADKTLLQRDARQLSEKEGLGFYAEVGGPGKPIHNVPFEELKALGSLTVPRGEFWNRHDDLNKLQIIKSIASAAHIYNQLYVEAEAFTSVW